MAFFFALFSANPCVCREKAVTLAPVNKHIFVIKVSVLTDKILPSLEIQGKVVFFISIKKVSREAKRERLLREEGVAQGTPEQVLTRQAPGLRGKGRGSARGRLLVFLISKVFISPADSVSAYLNFTMSGESSGVFYQELKQPKKIYYGNILEEGARPGVGRSEDRSGR